MEGRAHKPLQKEMVLKVLQKPSARRKGVTVYELMVNLGIGDPRARVRDLREDGYIIDTVFRDADGKFHPWGLYFLRDKEEVCRTGS